ncbi:MAG TPA: TonB family protein [Candidatus Sulfotelmatobacter sp.]|nr:TonB family protein [Candidatus Sulfotelmatobacter sp.]
MLRTSCPLALAVFATALAASPLSALAQTATFYVPPKIVKQGTASSAIAGSGKVEVKVFVHKNGSVGNVQIIKSSNPGDNAAATEIAKSASYRAATRDGKPSDAFYTYVLTFNGKSVALDVSGEEAINKTATSGEMTSINAEMGSANYAKAKSDLQAYLNTHAGDRQAETLLGAANFYLNDFTDAAAAFDQAGTVPPTFVAVAYNSYAGASDAAIKDKQYDAAVADAGHAAALQPQNPVPYFYRGTAETYEKKYADAIADLEKAKSLENAQTPPATVNTIDTALVQVYLAGGQVDKGVALAQQLRQRDPGNTQVVTILINHYAAAANEASQAGNVAAAVDDYEKAAQLDTAHAAAYYVGAASVLGNAAKTKDDFKKAFVEAQKAVAAAPSDAGANYTAGVLAANAGDTASATTYLQKAKANVGTDASLAAKIDTALKKIGH